MPVPYPPFAPIAPVPETYKEKETLVSMIAQRTPLEQEPAPPVASRSLEISQLSKVMDLPSPGSDTYTTRLPFSPRDVTAGVENELQTVVQGKKEDVDLAIAIENLQLLQKPHAPHRIGGHPPESHGRP